MLCSSGAKAVDKENAHYEIDGEQKYLGIYTDVHAVICECRRWNCQEICCQNWNKGQWKDCGCQTEKKATWGLDKKW